MKKILVIIFMLCFIFVSLSLGQKKLILHHTDLIDSPTNYVIPYGDVLLTMRVYPINRELADSICKEGGQPGAGILMKLKITALPRLCFGLTLKTDNLISQGALPKPKGFEDVIGALVKYRVMGEPVSFAIGLDYIRYARWDRTRGLYGVLGMGADGIKSKIFPYIGGNTTFERGEWYGGAFCGAELIPYKGVNLILDGSLISGRGFFLDTGVRVRFTRGLWVEFDLRNLVHVGGSKSQQGDTEKELNRMFRIWYQWRAPSR